MANAIEWQKKGDSLYESPKVDVIQFTQDVVRTSFLERGGEDNADWWS